MRTRPSIVIIEDDEDDFLLVKELLEEDFETPEIFWFAEAPDIDELLGQQRVDLFIVDYRLGNTSGDEYIRKIRSRDKVVGIILLTGVPTRSLDFKASEIGASDFLSKDEITGGALERSIRFMLESVRQKRELFEQSARMEKILKPTKMALWSMNLSEDKELFFSESVMELTGYSKRELEEESVKWIDLVEPEDAPEVSRMLHRVEKESRVRHEYRIRNKAGELIWVEEELHFTRALKGDTSWSRHPWKSVAQHFTRAAQETDTPARIEGRIQDITTSHEKEERIHLLANTLECAGDGILITEAELERPGPKIIYANQAMLDMTGYDRDELVGRTPRMLQGPSTDRKTMARLKACLRDRRQFNGVTNNRRKDGTEYCVSWNIRPLEDEDGQVTHYVSVQRDITDEQKQRLSLQQSEELLLAMGRSGNIGGWRYDPQNDVLVWTEQIYTICKLDPSEPPRMETWLECFGAFRDKLEVAIQRCLADGHPFSLELSFRDRQGHDLWIRITGEAQYLYDKVVGMWGTFQDITQLHDQDCRNRTFFNLSIDLSGVFAESGEILELNGDWEKVTGLSIDEMKKHQFIDFVVEEDKERTIEAHQQLQANDGLFNFENRWRHRNGEQVHLLWNSKVDPATKTTFAMCRDITDIKKKEIQLKEALLQAEIANRSKNQFLMVASHELRTPLNPIMGFADVLAQEITDPEHLNLLGMITDAATHLTSIVTDILDISSIDSGQASLLPKEFNFYDEMESLLALMQGKATDGGVSLELVRSELLVEFKDFTLRADKIKTRQVLFNLLSNAIKFSPGGAVKVEVEHIHREGRSISVTVAVIDNGIGIPLQELGRIFDRFHQVSMTETRGFGGQGLGLSISREYARMLGGDIRVSSQVDQGSVFRFDFKAEIVDDAEAVEVEPVRIEPEPSPAEAGAFKVLVAEDEAMNQFVVQKYLKKLEVEAVIVGDGVEAVRAAAEEPFALILMDLQMPNMSGIDACLEIRKSEGPNQHTKIFALTAHVDKTARDRCLEVGMDDFLEKPVSLEKFKQAIESVKASG